jgi:octaprenyl-diphosphate synthase
MAVLSKAFAEIVEGEIKQLVSLQNKELLCEANYFEIIEYKTAKLFSAACEVAAIVNDPSNEKTKLHLKEFGRLFGLIYQIKDDALDYFSNQTGKQRGADFYEGKTTLPIILLHQKADKAEKGFINQVFSNDDSRNQEAFQQILILLDKYKISSDISSKMQEILHSTKDLLTKACSPNAAQSLILKLIEDACI